MTTPTSQWKVFNKTFYPIEISYIDDTLINDDVQMMDDFCHGHKYNTFIDVDDEKSNTTRSDNNSIHRRRRCHLHHHQKQTDEYSGESLEMVVDMLMSPQEQMNFGRDYSDSTIVSVDYNTEGEGGDFISESSDDTSISEYMESRDVNNDETIHRRRNMIFPTHVGSNTISVTHHHNHCHETSVYTKNDVLLGRGGHCAHHHGNQEFLKERNIMYSSYQHAMTNDEKRAIQTQLIQTVFDKGGRFMVKIETPSIKPTVSMDSHDINISRRQRRRRRSSRVEYWQEVKDPQPIYRKASQALREGK